MGSVVALQKCEGPATCWVFLGIKVDTVAIVLHLLEEKLVRVKKLWGSGKPKRAVGSQTCSYKIKLFACVLVWAGRCFLRAMIQLCSVEKKQHHHTRLNESLGLI